MPALSPEQALFYQRIQAYVLDDPDTGNHFSHRLSQLQGWPADYTQRAIAEYRKFMFLAAIASGHLSPSLPVQQVWQQHLLYTESYWSHFCPRILGKLIHHAPDQSPDDCELQATLGFYTRYFGPPPPDIWSVELEFQPVFHPPVFHPPVFHPTSALEVPA